ncbi:hypothetical protein JOD16_001345 [Enterococcus xiangfangensis]|nr:hypothetical protein [Enterococcus xiangfangensis]
MIKVVNIGLEFFFEVDFVYILYAIFLVRYVYTQSYPPLFP